MSYILNLSNGSELIAGGLSDGFIDNQSTSLVLIGKNYAGYGEFINENFIRLLENFAAGTSPANPLKGQLWWDTTNNILKVYSGVSWKISTGATSSPFINPPSDLSALGGDLWFDTTNAQLKIYSGSDWITVGPASTPATGDSGAFPSIMVDTSGGSHIVTQIRIVGVPYVIISKDTFSSSLPGFSIIKAGINFSSIASPTMQLSNQEVNPIASSLVQRDSMGGVFGTSIVGQFGLFSGGVTGPSITATSSFSGNLVGNVTATTTTSQSVIATSLTATNIQGTILTASQPNITTLGNVVNLNTNGTTSLTGSATLNGIPIATVGGASFASINNTPVGNSVPSTGVFTTLGATSTTNTPTLLANAVNAAYIGNTGAIINGTVGTATQNSITTATSLVSVGNITTGTWSGTTVQPQYGGTGVNNGSNTLTVSGGNYTINQSVAGNASPWLTGTNFRQIPNVGLNNYWINVTAGSGLSGGGNVFLGGTVTLSASVPNPVSTAAGTTNQVLVNGGTSATNGAITLSLPQSIGTGSSVQFGSLGIGTGASGTSGEIRATNNITAYYSSDIKFKENIQIIPDALNKVVSIGGKTFDWTDEYIKDHGGEDGYFIQKSDFGIIAQDALKVFPQAVRTRQDGSLAVDYAKLSALAFAAIAELKAEIDELKSKIK